MTVKACERLDLVLYIVGANGLVEQLDKCRVDRIELEDVVVDHHERIVHLGTVGARVVGKHGNLGVWGQLVAKCDGTGDGLRKLRCGGGLAMPANVITSGSSPSIAIVQLGLECIEHHAGRVIRLVAGALSVEAVLAVDAVERADFAARRHHVDTERKAQATAADGPKMGLAFKNVDIGICSLGQLSLSIASAFMWVAGLGAVV